ncbi:MAG: hypothetical protein MRJ93_04510 [Nitrososphaeraceae archaeon]|nr:hypothetical protein [Nitrososphaeraceae archaeon]
MSENAEEKQTRNIVIANLSMPDGKNYEIPLVKKTFSSGREGYYAQIPAFIYNNDVYGGQIQVWRKGDTK